MSQRFYISNQTSSEIYFSTYHEGCAALPWLKGVPRCNTQSTPAWVTQYYQPSEWVEWSEFIISTLVNITTAVGLGVITVVTDGAAAPAEEADIESMVGDFLEGVEEATGESSQSIISKLVSTTSENFTTIAGKLGVSTTQLGGILVEIGSQGGLILLEAGLSEAFADWSWYLTNGGSEIWCPSAGMVLVDSQNLLFSFTGGPNWTSQDPSELAKPAKLKRLPGYKP